MPLPRILAFAYACSPDVGSEPGAGWTWAQLVAGLGETWVITRPWPARQAELLRAHAASPERARIHLVFVDIPRRRDAAAWDPFTSPNQRVDYLIWLAYALRAARRLNRGRAFDLVWHLTFANLWLGTVAGLVGPPSICGPVGGGVGSPWRLVPSLGWRGVASELVRAAGRFAGRHFNPFARLTWDRARLLLVQNEETRRWLPGSTRDRTVVFPNAVLEGWPTDAPSVGAAHGDRPPTALFAGRLLGWKGVGLAIEAIDLLPEWHLLIAGSGPDEPRLRRLVERHGLADRVTFLGWLPRAEVARVMQSAADVFVFPSFHDEGTWVVAEALSIGLPVVCLDRGGPPVMGGAPVQAGSVGPTVRRLATAIVRAREGDPPARRPVPSLERRREDLRAILVERGIPVATTRPGDG